VIAALESWWRGRDARVPAAPSLAGPRAVRRTHRVPAAVSDPTRTVRLAFVAPAEREHAARGLRWALVSRVETALAVISLGVVVAVWLTWLLDARPPGGGPPTWRTRVRSEAAPAATSRVAAAGGGDGAARGVPPTPRPPPAAAVHTLSLAELPDVAPSASPPAANDPCASTISFSDVPSAPTASSLASDRAAAPPAPRPSAERSVPGASRIDGRRIEGEARGDGMGSTRKSTPAPAASARSRRALPGAQEHAARQRGAARAPDARAARADDDLPQNPYGS
jgi:hypothetical protein